MAEGQWTRMLKSVMGTDFLLPVCTFRILANKENNYGISSRNYKAWKFINFAKLDWFALRVKKLAIKMWNVQGSKG